MQTQTDIKVLLLPAEKTAKVLGISVRQFYRKYSSGAIGPQAIRELGRPVWSYEEVQVWIKVGCPPRAEWLIVRKDYGFS